MWPKFGKIAGYFDFIYFQITSGQNTKKNCSNDFFFLEIPAGIPPVNTSRFFSGILCEISVVNRFLWISLGIAPRFSP